MHQRDYLTAIVDGTVWPFTEGLMVRWINLDIANDMDALGVLVMGGEL